MSDRTVTVEQAIQATSIPAGTFYSWRSRKQIKPVATNAAGKPLFRLDDVLALAARRTVHKLEVAPRPKRRRLSYEAVHVRLREQRGKPSMCTFCDQADPEAKYEWALNWAACPTTIRNSSGREMEYSVNPDDYIRLCARCHRQFDREHARDVAQRRVA